MNKKKILIGVICTMSIFIVGCNNQIPNMTEEESMMVSEYAASLLLSYDKNYSSKLDEIVIEEKEEIIPEVSTVPELEEEDKPEVEIPDISEPVIGEENDKTSATLEEIYEVEGITFVLKDIRVAKTCSENGIEDGMLSYIAMDGKELVIAEVIATNTTEEAIELNMIQKNPSMYMMYEGTKQNVQPTMLLNDFTTYMGMIDKNTEVELVIVAEYKEGLVEDLEKVKIFASHNGKKFVIE